MSNRKMTNPFREAVAGKYLVGREKQLNFVIDSLLFTAFHLFLSMTLI